VLQRWLAGMPKNVKYPSLNNAISKTWLIENIDQSQLNPQSLYEAMHAVRMSSPNKVSKVLGGQGSGGKPLSAY
jgi:hypothetical protein